MELIELYRQYRGQGNVRQAAQKFPPEQQLALLCQYALVVRGIRNRCARVTEEESREIKSMCAIYTALTGQRLRCTHCQIPQTLAKVEAYLRSRA